MDYKKELWKRRFLAQQITEEFVTLGNPLPDIFTCNAGKLATLPTHIASGSMIDWQFAGKARSMGLTPLWAQFLDDRFESCNGRKNMYLHTFDTFGNKQKHANPHQWNGQKISAITLKDGQSLIEYHHTLWRNIPGKKLICDLSRWLQFFGTSQDYYYHTRKINLAFAVEFWPANITGLYRDGEKHALYNMISRIEQRLADEYGVEPLVLDFHLQPTFYGEVS